jgi:hypothetical protein
VHNVLKNGIRNALRKAIEATKKQRLVTTAAVDKLERLQRLLDKLVEKAAEKHVYIGDLVTGEKAAEAKGEKAKDEKAK